MYNQGIKSFCERKNVNITEAVLGFLSNRQQTFSFKHHNRVNDYIECNWTAFATWVDTSIKSGALNGKSIKLNTSYGEKRQYDERVREEFKKAGITKEEQFLLDKIKKQYGVGFIQSFLMKNGYSSFGKDDSFFSKTLQWLPLVRHAIKHGILNEPDSDFILEA